ncbi:hypothetical protein [Salsuginibacillus kocurii]|uniref:hypothetical protein n=1 Tax=Salsuginibacillus kocurii TaxID=427078 RepID=UPI0003753CD3|nr:hypothetical protein [Salsuginibacillus kocurii]
MVLVQCLKSIYKQDPDDIIKYPDNIHLFKEGYLYPIFSDEFGTWFATDEENLPHVVAEGSPDDPEVDPWFRMYFKKV